MSDDNRQPKKRGCAILFVPTLIVIDIVGMFAGSAGQYSSVVFALGIVGFVCGAALGAYYSAMVRPDSKWSLSFWVVSLGLIGTMIVFTIAFLIACATKMTAV